MSTAEGSAAHSRSCADCGSSLEVSGTEQHPYWWCPRCRVAVLGRALLRAIDPHASGF